MKKTILILSVLAFIASSCGNKKQTGYENIPADSIQVINETCLVLKYPKAGDFDNEEASEVLSDFSEHSVATIARFQKLGINTVAVEKRYLSFALNNGESHIIDTKEHDIFKALLYKKGEIPISVHIVGYEWKSVADYLNMKESELIKIIESEIAGASKWGEQYSFEGTYKNNHLYGDDCNTILHIKKTDDGYSFILLNGSEFKGKVSILDGGIRLEGVPWVSYLGALDDDGNPIEKDLGPMYGIEATVMEEDGNLVLTIQNSGNSMNSYQILNCGDKMIALEKEKK